MKIDNFGFCKHGQVNHGHHRNQCSIPMDNSDEGRIAERNGVEERNLRSEVTGGVFYKKRK